MGVVVVMVVVVMVVAVVMVMVVMVVFWLIWVPIIHHNHILRAVTCQIGDRHPH